MSERFWTYSASDGLRQQYAIRTRVVLNVIRILTLVGVTGTHANVTDMASFDNIVKCLHLNIDYVIEDYLEARPSEHTVSSIGVL